MGHLWNILQVQSPRLDFPTEELGPLDAEDRVELMNDQMNGEDVPLQDH